MCLSLKVVKIIPLCGLIPDVCNNVLESCICVIYITKLIICLFVDQENGKLHIEGVYIFVVSVVSFLRWKM